MARPYLKRKLQTYRALYHINRDFSVLIQHLWELQFGGFVVFDKMEIFREYVRELQAEINHDATSVMQPIEARDWFCISVLGKFSPASVDFVLTDRPYLVGIKAATASASTMTITPPGCIRLLRKSIAS